MPRAFLASIVFFFAAGASAAGAGVQVTQAWTRATPPGQTTAAIYMTIRSDADAAVVTAESPVAARAELHSMTTDGGVMRMRPLPKLELRKGQNVQLAPNGAHLMLVDLKRPLKPGEKVPVTLSIQAAGASTAKVEVLAEVRGLTEGAPHHH